MTSCFTSASIALMRSTENAALRLDLGCSLFRNDAFLREHFCDSEFDIKPSLVFVLILPDVCPSGGACNVVSLSNYNRIGSVG